MKTKIKKLTMLFTVIIGCILTVQNAKAQSIRGYQVSLFSKTFNEGTGLATFSSIGYPFAPASVTPEYKVPFGSVQNFSDFPNLNDRAKSTRFTATKGMTIVFFRNANQDYSDAHTKVYIKQAVNGYVLDSFQRNYEDVNIKVTYYNPNSLDGNVSCMTVYEGM